MTSGTPPARKTRTVGWPTGPFGSTSTSRGTEDLAATARRSAGATPEIRRLLERHLAVSETCADRLDFAGVLSVARRQRDATRHEDRRQVAHRRQCQHHRGQALVTRRDAE